MPIPERPADNDEIEARIVLTEHDARAAALLLHRLSSAFGYHPSQTHSDGQLTREELEFRARTIFERRCARFEHFNRAMFGEPAWDILLVLYMTDASGGRQTPGKLAEWIGAPASTVVRWIDYLEKERLVARQPHPTDKRVIFIRLLDKGRLAMDDYLGGLSDWSGLA